MAVYNNATCTSGDMKLRRIPKTAGVLVKQGNFMVQVSSAASLASSLADSGTKAQNQEAAHDIFLGVSQDESLAAMTKDILVATAGVHTFPCTALGQAYPIGTFFGLAGTGSAGAVGVSDTDVEPVATANLAIGKLAALAASGATSVSLELTSTLYDVSGGTQAAA